MKKLWLVVTLILLLGLVFATTQVLASPGEQTDLKQTPDRTPGARATERAVERATEGRGHAAGQRVHLKGTIDAVGAASLTITPSDGSPMTVALTDETRIKIPTMGNNGTVSDLQVGMTVAVHGRQDETGLVTADSVMVIPGKPALAHNVGTVTEYQEGVSITIENKDGDTFTYQLTEDTKILPEERADQLEVGARVTIIAPRDMTSLDLTAKGIVVHPEGSGGGTDDEGEPPEDAEGPTEIPTDVPTDVPAP